MGAEVDYQVAAPAEIRTPNLHRAKIAQQRVRMEGWRQRRLGSNARNPQEGRRKTDLTHAGLIMEGLGRRKPIKRWFFTKANEPSSVRVAQSVNLKTALTTVFISGVNIASYPRARPQTPCLRAGLRDDPESPAESTYMEVWWVDSVVESFRLVSHEISLHPFSVVR